MQNREQAHQRSANIDHGLYYVGPDHRCQPALEGINQCERGNDRNRRDLARAQGDRYHDGNGIDPDPFGGAPGD